MTLSCEVGGFPADLLRASDEQRIRAALAQPGVGGVEYHCFSRAEADTIRARLTPVERLRTRFWWNVFGARPVRVGDRETPP